MASSRGTSNNPDWQDIASVLQAFQHINRCTVDLGLQVVVKGSRIELALTAHAWEPGVDRRVVKPLGSASVTCSASGLRSLEAAAIHLLYLLDGKLASAEMGSVEHKS